MTFTDQTSMWGTLFVVLATTVSNTWTEHKRVWSALYLISSVCFLLMSWGYHNPWLIGGQLYMAAFNAYGLASTFQRTPS